jgi:hypothetical protein
VGDFERRNPLHAGMLGLGVTLWAPITRSLARLPR